MRRNKLVVIIYVFILCLFKVSVVFAQAPIISYPTPTNVYHINISIPTLIPDNSGGAVPATIYGEVSTFAGGRAPVTYDSQGTDAGFDLPSGVANYAGVVYVTDFGSGAIRKITPNAVVTTIAHVNSASGIVADNQGNLFITDFQDNKIFKITPAGITSVFAGTGASGAVNGPANIATFHNPGGIAIDASGNLYVADQQNNMIREITSAGVVSTFAGSGTAGIQNGPALSAKFNSPDGVAVDGLGNVYVADTKNNLIRKITPSGVVSTVAGTGSPGMADGASGSASFNYPTSIIVDAQQNLYIADYKNNKIRKITPGGIVSTITGNDTPGSTNGIGTAASFNYPLGLTINSAGEVYITDEVNYLIRKLLLTGYTIDKPLPPGLTFDPKTGKISGTPTALSPATDYTVTAYNGSGGSSTVVNITVKDAQPLIFPAIPDKTVCDIDFDPGATSSLPITYTSSNLAVAIIVADKIHIVNAGTTIITASDGTSTYLQTLTVITGVTPSVTISPVTFDECSGIAVTYTATPVNGGPAPHYQWKVNGQNSGPDNVEFISSNLNNNDKIACVLTSSVACTSSPTATSNEAVFTLDPPVSTAVSITSSLNGPVCAGTEIAFTATPATPDSKPGYQWQVNGNNAGTNSSTFSSKTLADGDIVTCILTSTGKCLINPGTSSNAIIVKLSAISQCVIVIPNTFTPNGDGINDFWNITALQGYPNCSITVFTRYGSVIYKSTGYVNAWDGTYNGSALPVGTYYYILDIKNGKKPLSGYVTILR